MLARLSTATDWPASGLWRRMLPWLRTPEESCVAARSGRECVLDERDEPPVGAHLVTPRIGFVHHGIYLGAGKVMHCGGIPGLVPGGPVEEVSLAYFSRGRPIAVTYDAPARFSAQEVVARARSRAGEDGYRLLTNNCEHFCEWCLRGRHRSYQVERLMRWLRPWNVRVAGQSRALH
jgi:hypothetical protein